MKASDCIGRAIASLIDCESELRRLVGQAADEGDYSSVLRIAEMAKAVAALATEGRGLADAGGAAAANGESAPAHVRGVQRAEQRTASSEGYPQFYRRGDELVKVGWSRTEAKEYIHRAGRRGVEAVAAAVRQLGARGRLFTGDKLLPINDPATGSRVPDYQVYVALAWLKHLGLIEHEGRRSGYALIPGKQIESTITAAWPELAEWRG